MENDQTCKNTSQRSRADKLKTLVIKSRLALGLPDVGREVIDRTAHELDELLDQNLTVDRLDEVYAHAMRSKTNSYALSLVELHNAWHAIIQQEKAQEPMVCPGCKLEQSDPTYPCRVHTKK